MDEAKAVTPGGVPERIGWQHQGLLAGRYFAYLGYFAFALLGCLIMGLGEDSVLLVLSLTIYALVGYIFLHQSGGFSLTPITLFFLFFTTFTYAGGLILFFSNGAGVSYGGGDRNYVFYLAVHGGILALAVGVLFASIAFEFSPKKELLRFRRTPWRDAHNLPGNTIAIALIAGVALLMTLIYVRSRGTLPLVEVLLAQGTEDVYDLAVATRAEYSRYGTGAGSYFYQGYFQQFYVVILPFVTLYIGSRYLHYRKAGLRVLWLMLAVATGFFLALSLQRWPLMFFIVLNYILYVNYAGRIRLSHALVFMVLILFFFGFLTYIRGLGNFATLVDSIITRIFMVNLDVFYSTFEMFPEHFSFFGGQAMLADIKGILPGPHEGFSRWFFDAVYQTYGNGTAPSIFWQQLYADFGLAGVWVGSVLAGFIMQGVYIAFIRGKKDLLRLVVYTIITMALGELATASPVTVLFQLGVVTALLLVVALEVMGAIFHAGPFPDALKPKVISVS